MKNTNVNVKAAIVVGKQDGYVLPVHVLTLSAIADADGRVATLTAERAEAVKAKKLTEVERLDREIRLWRAIANGGRRAFLSLSYGDRKPFDCGATSLSKGDSDGVAAACGMVALCLGMKVSSEACAELAAACVLAHKRLRANPSAVAESGFSETTSARTDFLAAFFGGLWDTLKAHGVKVAEDGAVVWPKWYERVSVARRVAGLNAAAGFDIAAVEQAAKIEQAAKAAAAKARKRYDDEVRAAKAAATNADPKAAAEKAQDEKVRAQRVNAKAAAEKAAAAAVDARAAARSAAAAKGALTRANKAAALAEAEAVTAANTLKAAQARGAEAAEIQAIEAEAREKVGIARRAAEARAKALKAAEAAQAKAEKAQAKAAEAQAKAETVKAA